MNAAAIIAIIIILCIIGRVIYKIGFEDGMRRAFAIDDNIERKLEEQKKRELHYEEFDIS